MRKALLVVLLVFAVLAFAGVAYAGVSFIRTGRVSAAGLGQGFGWFGMPMMRGLSQGNTPQTACPGAGSGSYYNGPGMMNGLGSQRGPGMMNGWGNDRGPGMMGRNGTGNPSGEPYGNCPYSGSPSKSPNQTRLTTDQAIEKATSYIADDKNLTVSEVMEFENNFYAVVLEKDTGKGAIELLVDPYSGYVSLEMGPGMMWNQKYGHMGKLFGGSEEISIEDAVSLAQQTLDKEVPGAKVESDGVAFYGYFTFDYTVDGKTAGMLSVNAITQQTWVHTWHGAFIGEVELVE